MRAQSPEVILQIAQCDVDVATLCLPPPSGQEGNQNSPTTTCQWLKLFKVALIIIFSLSEILSCEFVAYVNV